MERMRLTFNNVDGFNISGLGYRCGGHKCSSGDQGQAEEEDLENSIMT